VKLQAGDVIVFPHGDAHALSSDPGMRAAPDRELLHQWRPPQLPFMLRQGLQCRTPGDAAARASVLCGFLGCDRRPFNPLLATLPRMIHVPADELTADGEGWVAQFARLAAAESRDKRPGGEVVLERLSELLFVDLLRRYLERLPEDQRGWLAGLRDRHVGRVLGLMHERPAEPWTMEQIAQQVGLSRSALHDRFVQFIGLTPMQYLTAWRMQIASRLLVQGSQPLASVALEAGYDSEAAFSRAFKRAVGVPPSVWRRERASSSRRGAAAGVLVSDAGPRGSA
jgi:AraC-like DNA-binding protein